MLKRNHIYQGHVLDIFKTLPDGCVDMIVTSPPYYGLRAYGTNPQIWDAQEGCDHDWNSGIAAAGDIRHRATDATIVRSNKSFGKEYRPNESNFCSKCNAWRGELGLEPTPELYIKHLVQIFSQAKRVLKDTGVLWLNLGDSYAGGGGSSGHTADTKNLGRSTDSYGSVATNGRVPVNLKPKDLIGIPWMAAFALRADGWYLRQEVIWNKNNPMPESVTDRCTKSHESIFLLTKSQRYYFDNEAIKEPATFDNDECYARIKDDHKSLPDGMKNGIRPKKSGNLERKYDHIEGVHGVGHSIPWEGLTRNKRSVWSINTQPYPEAHFATFPEELPELCIKAGSSEHGCCAECGAPWERIISKQKVFTSGSGKSGKLPTGKNGEKMQGGGNTGDIRMGPTNISETTGWQKACSCETMNVVPAIVCDLFFGSGTTGSVARRLGRDFIGCELNEEYIKLAEKRMHKAMGMFA